VGTGHPQKMIADCLMLDIQSSDFL